tara:strand:+ start:177 stop:398 length:222 start_codon:yes stop_codon:yes gene_type:complete
MNLYDYSQNHNIEFGIVTARASGLDRLKEKVIGIELDNDAWQYFNSVIERSELVYHNLLVVIENENLTMSFKE